jgi:hypothetical protein
VVILGKYYFRTSTVPRYLQVLIPELTARENLSINDIVNHFRNGAIEAYHESLQRLKRKLVPDSTDRPPLKWNSVVINSGPDICIQS